MNTTFLWLRGCWVGVPTMHTFILAKKHEFKWAFGHGNEAGAETQHRKKRDKLGTAEHTGEGGKMGA